MSSTFFETVRGLSSRRYFTIDEEPGRTYCWRPFKDKHASIADKGAVRALRLVAASPHSYDAEKRGCIE